MSALPHLLYKELLLEWRTLGRVQALVFMGGLSLLLFSFATGPNHALLRQVAAGYLWISVLLASVTSLSESFRLESENGALDGLRLLGVDARWVFLAKALSSFVWILLSGIVFVPLAVALYDLHIRSPWTLLCTLVLGCGAIAAPGTLYAAMVSRARARDVLLPLLLCPILVPGLVAAVKATTLALEGDPMGQTTSWLGLLLIFNLVYWVLCTGLFGRVIED